MLHLFSRMNLILYYALGNTNTHQTFYWLKLNLNELPPLLPTRRGTYLIIMKLGTQTMGQCQYYIY